MFRALGRGAIVLCVLVAPAGAQPKKGRPPEPKVEPKPDPAAASNPAASKKKPPGEKTFDFNNLDLNGRMRTPQLLYFLERANEELERASLEKRSFIPHMVRSVEEEPL
ncbi:MAG: hypothetical protein H0T79_15020 [Deltaproteobacteria bacterium]|nr:hypothetical protein [Deltaproteobacteria bacterium]